MSQASNNLAAYCWSLADLLRGDFKQSQYGRIILPFTLLRRLECVLAPTKDAVLAEMADLTAMNYPVAAHERILIKATGGQSFFNTSRMDLGKLGEADVKDNLESYISAFSKDAREIFEYFNFSKFIAALDDANLLYRIVQRVAQTDLSPASVTNHDMGLVFEELIRRFAESSNETAGEHFTPRDIVRLTTALVFTEDDEALGEPGAVRSIYDPTAGTGGFLSAAMDHVLAMNPGASLALFGQELNPESYAICKGDMLIKGQNVSRIKLGNTLSGDQLQDHHFDYMLSNPPFGVDWKKIETEIKDEHAQKGLGGRFGPGLPRVSDGSLLFLLHLIAKMRRAEDGGARIGIILNGSPLFTGGAGSGESEIRRYVLENDLLEAIVALPTDMFYNTGIATYIWILSNKKNPARKGKLQLINAVNLYGKMRKSLGSKRNEMGEADQAMVIRCFGDFEVLDAQPLDKPADVKSNRGRQAVNGKEEAPKTFASKIFPNHAFGYRRLTIERPLRESFQFSDERLASLRFAPRPLDEPMAYLYETYGQDWRDGEDDGGYGDLHAHQVAIRKTLKTQFPSLKEAKIKALLKRDTWLQQREVLVAARKLQKQLGTAQHDDMNHFDALLKKACVSAEVDLDAKMRKQIKAAVSWKNPEAAKVVKKVHKAPPNPLYGLFPVDGKTVAYQADSELRDYENVALDPSQPVDAVNEAYVRREVLPHVPEAWIDGTKRDARDGEVGVVGYSINFPHNFLNEIDIKNHNFKKIKCKSFLTPNKNGYYLIRYNLQIVIFDGSVSRGYRIDIDGSLLDLEYFNYFITTEHGSLWKESIPNVSSGVYSVFEILKSDIWIPSLEYQMNVVRLKKQQQSILEKLILMDSSLLLSPSSFEQQLLPFSNTTQRYEDDFQNQLPQPLATLWNQASSKYTKKEFCEYYCKFYEYLGLFFLSVAMSSLGNEEIIKLLKRGKNIKWMTMGSSLYDLKKIADEYGNNIQDRFRYIISPGIVKLLMTATDIRNDVAHRGLPSMAEVTKVYKRIEDLNQEFQTLIFDFFAAYTMFRPAKCIFDGDIFEYEADTFKGHALNPCSTTKLRCSNPLKDGQLYFAEIKDDELTECFPLFPLLIIDEIIDQTKFLAFYFYSDIFEGKLRFVCPYPNIVTYKFKEQSLFLGN